jgi:hypothetical protein
MDGRAATPQPDFAKRMECVQLAAALYLDTVGHSKRQQAVRTPYASRGPQLADSVVANVFEQMKILQFGVKNGYQNRDRKANRYRYRKRDVLKNRLTIS